MLRRRWQVMLGQQRPKGSMCQMVTIEELVPKDHFLRQLDAAVDFSFIRERVRHLYCEDNGRPSIDPELALRMFVLSYLRSEEHTSELQSRPHLVCRLLLEKKKQ